MESEKLNLVDHFGGAFTLKRSIATPLRESAPKAVLFNPLERMVSSHAQAEIRETTYPQISHPFRTNTFE